MHRLGFAVAALSLLALPALAADPIGSAEEIRNFALQTPPGASRAPLKLKDDVFSDATIETASDSATRLVFLDQTDLRLESNSLIVLDSYVYNPQTKTTDAVLSFAGGAFRFISGIAKENVEIRSPMATIGIRGTDFRCEWYPPNPLRCEVFEGLIELSPGGTGKAAMIAAGQIGTLYSKNDDVIISQLAFLEPGSGGTGPRIGQPTFVQFSPPPLENPAQDVRSGQ